MNAEAADFFVRKLRALHDLITDESQDCAPEDVGTVTDCLVNIEEAIEDIEALREGGQ